MEWAIGRGEGQGERGRSTQRQDGVSSSVSVDADAACNRSGSFNGDEAAAVREDPFPARGGLASLDHSRPPNFLVDLKAIHAHTFIPQIHQHAHAPEVITSSFPVPASTGNFLTRVTAAVPLVDEQSKLLQGVTLPQGQGGQGGRGSGRYEQSQGGSLSFPECREETLNKTASSGRGKGVAGGGKRLDQENRPFVLPTTSAPTVTDGLNYTRVDLPSLEHGRSTNDCFKPMRISESYCVGEIREHMHPPPHTYAQNTRVCETTFFPSLLPASCTATGVSGPIQSTLLHAEGQRRLGDQELGQHSISSNQGVLGELASMEESLSRGRGRRGRGQGQGGRGRGRSGRRQEVDTSSNSVSAANKTANRKRAEGAPGQGKHRKEATSNHEISAPELSMASTGAIAAGGQLSFSQSSCAQDYFNSEKNQENVCAPEFRVSETHAAGNSLRPATCLGSFDSSVHSVGSSQVEEQGRRDDHVEAPSCCPSSPKGGNLRQELADFLMITSHDTDKAGDQTSKGGRRKTKSRKVVENENLWRELTGESSDLKSAGSALNPTANDGGKMSREIDTSSTVCVEETNGVSKEGECFNSTEGEGICDASLIEHGANVNVKISGKKRMRQVLKDHGRFPRSSLQDHGNVIGRLHQASDIDTPAARPESQSGFSSATEGASASMESFTSTCGSIEFVEDWKSYCPYATDCPNLISVYKNGGPSIISLPLFGSSRVTDCTDKTWPDYYDLMLNVGGSVWALDWCPKRGYTDGYRREFLAVGAHPYDAPTHRLGELVQGKGLIQIWAFDLPFLSHAQANWHFQNSDRYGRGKQKARSVSQARGKHKKDTAEDEDVRELFVPDATEISEDVCNPQPLFVEEIGHKAGAGIDFTHVKVESFVPALPLSEESDLPQMVLGLAHDAGLIWDAKWQPTGTDGVAFNFDSNDACRLGFLAAVFGDGSIQVYDIPLPSMVRTLPACGSNHSSLSPLVVKIKPVFRCSGLSAGGQTSLPLTIEWSSHPHDLLLVGCHDGAVALWRFKPDISCNHDTRPLTCFVADTAPIRALAFAPEGSDAESRNVIVTGGHSGRLLFWDLRDPFYPLWDLALSKGGCIYSVDWPLYPRGIVLCMDDGTVRTLSLDIALCDSPLTGTPPTKSLSQGVHTSFASDYALWSIHVSRRSGVAVYGGEDGSIIQFQLTEKYFVNDRARVKEPHFMCCKLIEDPTSGVLSLPSLSSDAPLPVKNQRGDNKQVPLTKAFSRRASGIMNEEVDESKKKRRRQASKSSKRNLLKGEETDDDELSSDEVNNLALVPFDPNQSAKPKSLSRSLSAKVGSEGSKRRNVKKQGDPTVGSGREAEALLESEAQPANALPERPPSKAVAVHRVRWNQNKDCESLACFAGAAGIIRCQLIMPRA